MLHMLQSAEEGGHSLFVDGFHVAEQVRTKNRDSGKIIHREKKSKYISNDHVFSSGISDIINKKKTLLLLNLKKYV